jgi:hypothetical protein
MSSQEMDLHDARMVSIELHQESVVTIGFIDENGGRSTLQLERVERMRGLDFREGNIVLEATGICGVSPPIDVLRRLFDIGPNDLPKYLLDAAKRISNGRATLLHIIPSYGCELIALCYTAKLCSQA